MSLSPKSCCAHLCSKWFRVSHHFSYILSLCCAKEQKYNRVLTRIIEGTDDILYLQSRCWKQWCSGTVWFNKRIPKVSEPFSLSLRGLCVSYLTFNSNYVVKKKKGKRKVRVNDIGLNPQRLLLSWHRFGFIISQTALFFFFFNAAGLKT